MKKVRRTYERAKIYIFMLYGLDLNALVVALIVFSPLIVGFSVLFYIKSKQGKKLPIKPKSSFESIFGL